MRHRLSWAVGIASAFCILLPPLAARAQSAGLPVCADCHEEVVQSIVPTKHGAKLDSTDAVCRSCHGDVAAHLDDPEAAKPTHLFNKSVAAADKAAVCLGCHSGSRQLAFWDAGTHKRNDVACSDCHSIHGKKSEPKTGRYVTTQRKLQQEVCASCHQRVMSQMEKNSHHPILEGKVSCSDCHNPHGAMTHAMIKADSVNLLCTGCHTEKRGPFVFTHMPVEENCLTCHDSHGSNVPKLLTEKVPQLCQECHGSGHGQYAYGATFVPGGQDDSRSSRFMSRSCINCHNQIHGTNAPASRGEFLIR
jgi:DmsE family decaheme c-type cytochrome